MFFKEKFGASGRNVYWFPYLICFLKCKLRYWSENTNFFWYILLFFQIWSCFFLCFRLQNTSDAAEEYRNPVSNILNVSCFREVQSTSHLTLLKIYMYLMDPTFMLPWPVSLCEKNISHFTLSIICPWKKTGLYRTTSHLCHFQLPIICSSSTAGGAGEYCELVRRDQ
jgi:hypothetical protein